MKKKIFFGIIITVFISVNTGYPQDPDKTKTGTMPASISKEDKSKFIESASKLLNEYYVFPEIAEKIETYLKTKLEQGVYDTISNIMVFTEVMTNDMQSVSHDKHMRVRLEPPPIVKTEKDDPALNALLGKKELAETNYGFAKVEVLKGNIGYIDLRRFAPLELGKENASAAMKLLSNSYAIIFDLRKNGGGNPEMIQYICSFFFDQPTHLNSLYYRKGDKTTEYWTLKSIDGKKMADVPLYILTSKYTFSGGEEFCYNMLTRKRATLIGEVTGGGANPGTIFPVYKNLMVFIPTGKAINPVTGTNWEGTGVKPDIEIPADKALDLAIDKAAADAKKYREARLDELVVSYKEIHAKIDEAEKLFNLKKDAEAEKMLSFALETGLKDGILEENFINDLGYNFLGKDENKIAIAVFKFNIRSFPDSANAFDSLGEAYLKNGDKKLATDNYKKSLELNPGNDNARKILKDLTGTP